MTPADTCVNSKRLLFRRTKFANKIKKSLTKSKCLYSFLCLEIFWIFLLLFDSHIESKTKSAYYHPRINTRSWRIHVQTRVSFSAGWVTVMVFSQFRLCQNTAASVRHRSKMREKHITQVLRAWNWPLTSFLFIHLIFMTKSENNILRCHLLREELC